MSKNDRIVQRNPQSGGEEVSRKEIQRSRSSNDDRPQTPNLQGDYQNIGLLLLLYVLQGIPLGLIASIPYLLSNRDTSYSDQAIFSFAAWPFSLKLFWAPIVDSIYWNRLGKRKSWMVPAQYLIGIFMITVSYYLKTLMEDTKGPSIYLLTLIFLSLNFLAATQDIAVDGWALTMLKPRNVGYASTCNTVGQTAGYFLGYVLFLILESPHFANYFRSEPKPEGLITLQGFFFFWGCVFIVITSLVMIFKSEKSSKDHPQMSISETYGQLRVILKLPPVLSFTAILLTCKIGFGITDSATGLKLKEAGLPMDQIALLAIPMLPLQIILPWIISRWTNGPRPLDVFLWAYPYRLFFNFVFAGFLHWTRQIQGSFPIYYYVVLILIYVGHQLFMNSMYVAIMAFHAKISDPKIGGTYMTLLNTITNFGGNWPATLALWLLDYTTLSYCSHNENICFKIKDKPDPCLNEDGTGGECLTYLDGFYIETFALTIVGIIWLYVWGKKRIDQVQSLPPSAWRCETR